MPISNFCVNNGPAYTYKLMTRNYNFEARSASMSAHFFICERDGVFEALRSQF